MPMQRTNPIRLDLVTAPLDRLAKQVTVDLQESPHGDRTYTGAKVAL